MIPDPLQVQRLTARTRARDHEVTAELEVERRQRRIAIVGKARDTLIGGQGALFRRGSQIERDAVEEAFVIGDVLLAKRRIGLACRARQIAAKSAPPRRPLPGWGSCRIR